MLGRKSKKGGAVIALSGVRTEEEKRETEEIDRILSAQDLYDVMGLEYTPHWDSQEEALREAYLDRSRLLNPSENTDSRLPQAAARLAEAYDTLSDEQLRRKYNLEKGFERNDPFGPLLGLLTQAFGGIAANPTQQRNRAPPQNGPRTTPAETRQRVEQQQRQLEEQHEEQQRNLREQEAELSRMRRRHQSGAIPTQRGRAPPEERQSQSQNRAPTGSGGRPGGYHMMYGGGGGGGQRQGQGGQGGQLDIDALEARLRQMMQAALGGGGLGGGQGQGRQQEERQGGRQQEENYTEELAMLREMGFQDEQQCLHALRQARGNVELAIEFMVQGGA